MSAMFDALKRIDAEGGVIQRFMCWMGWCGDAVLKDDDTGIWGECVRCGRRHGFVDSATLRRAADRAAR